MVGIINKWTRIWAGTAEVSTSNPLPVKLEASTNNQEVDLVAINGGAPVTGSGVATGALRVELPTNGTGTVGLIAGAAIVGKVGIDQTTPGTTNGVQVNAALPAGSAVIGKVDHSTTGFGDGVKTITAAGTDEALAGSTAAKWVMIQAQTDNTSKIAIGATGVDATVATGDGILLDPGDKLVLPCDNLADIFVDALVSGEGVRYFYGT